MESGRDSLESECGQLKAELNARQIQIDSLQQMENTIKV